MLDTNWVIIWDFYIEVFPNSSCIRMGLKSIGDKTVQCRKVIDSKSVVISGLKGRVKNFILPCVNFHVPLYCSRGGQSKSANLTNVASIPFREMNLVHMIWNTEFSNFRETLIKSCIFTITNPININSIDRQILGNK